MAYGATPYVGGQTTITAKGEKILDLPAGGYNNHWTRNLLARPDGQKIYVSVGSASNVAEHGMKEEKRRANILEINPDGTGERVYAAGLRNPVGMDWAPGTGRLWAAVNERDELGDELVPDYLTSVQDSGFYGWPYSYFGQHVDPRRQGEKPELVRKALVPDVALGAHTASLGLAFYNRRTIPGALPQRRVCGAARLLEPFRICGLQGCVRAFQPGQAYWPARRFPDRLHRQRREKRSVRPAGGRDAAAQRRAAGSRRRGR